MEVVGDQIVERLLTEFRSGYDLGGAGEWLEDALMFPTTRSWRSVVFERILDQGRRLEDGIEAEVRRIVRIED